MRQLALAGLLCGALAFVTPAEAQAPWLGQAGGGMLSVQEARILEPGRIVLGIVVDNYDRDPLGLDIVDYRFAWRTGIFRHLELYGRYEFSRAVSLPGGQGIPPPPLDIVDLTG